MGGCTILKSTSYREWSGWQRKLQIFRSRMANRIDSLANSAELIPDSVLKDPEAVPRFSSGVL